MSEARVCFEFKAAEAIHPKHRGQGIHYLFLFDLGHGKIVNVRNEEVEHEFVNCNQRLVDLPFTQNGTGVSATLDANPNLTPPGWYMLFGVDTAGTPSVATWVHVV